MKNLGFNGYGHWIIDPLEQSLIIPLLTPMTPVRVNWPLCYKIQNNETSKISNAHNTECNSVLFRFRLGSTCTPLARVTQAHAR